MTANSVSVDVDLAALLASQRAQAAAKRTEPDVVAARRQAGDRVPLHPAQQRLAFLARYEPDSPAYNVVFRLELAADVDEERLGTAITALLSRHDVLRQVVVLESDPPLAELREVPARSLTVIRSGEAGDPGSGEAELDRVAATPFDIGTEIPFRPTLLIRDGRSPVLQLVVHHVAIDAWSGSLLVGELEALYAGETLPNPVQYADVADRGTAGIAADLDWWRDRLDPSASSTTIPTDRPRPAVASPEGADVDFTLPMGAITDAARDHGTTPAAVLLGAVRLLLHRTLGVSEATVGMPESGRLDPAQDDVVGCFINTLPVTGVIDPATVVRDSAADLRDALVHRAAPFDRIVDAVAPPRDLSTTPLFWLMLNVHSAGGLATGRLVRGVTVPDLGSAKYDLGLTVDAATGAASLTYRTALLDEATARSWAHWFVRAVEAVCAGSDLVLEPAAELSGGPATPLPGTLVDRIAATVETYPEATAVLAPDGDLTYAALWERSAVIARRLVAAGAAGRPVGVFVERSVDLLVGAVAAWRAGAAYLPLDPVYPPERVAAALSTAGCGHVLTQRPLTGDVPTGVEILVLDDPEVAADRAVSSAVSSLDLAAPSADALAYVISTSGSTGAPKAVGVTHANAVDYLGGALPRLGLPDHASFMLASTPAADLGMTCLLGALVTGGTLHLLDRAEASDPVRFARRVADHRIDLIKLVPSHLEMLAAHGDLDALLPATVLMLAGEPIPWHLVRAVRAVRPALAVHASYGPSETTVAVSWCDTASVPESQRHGVVPLGEPYPGVELAVLDAEGRPVPRGLIGELVVTGPSVSAGYLGAQPAKSGFVERAGRRWYRTGDLVRIHHSGRVDVQGRVDDQVKVRGHRVELDDVVAACTEVPGVRAAVVLPRGEAHRRKLVAWLALEDGATLEPAAVRAALRDTLPDYMLPSDLVVIDDVPLTPNGKVDRAALPSPDDVVAPPGRPLSTDTERAVAAAFAASLGIDVTSVDDDFFALGGDSFGAVRTVAAIGGGLAIVDLFRNPTVAELARLLEEPDEVDTTAWPLGRPILQQLSGPSGDREPAVTLVCLPYGGGAAVAYQPLASALPPEWAVLAAELPGHDPMAPDEELRSLSDVLDQIVDEVAARTGGPVAVYGHCLGAAGAAALGQRLERRGLPVVGVGMGGSLPAARLPGRLSRAISRRLPTDRFVPDRTYRELLGAMGGLDDVDGADELAAARNEAMLRALRHDARQAEELCSRALEDDADSLQAPMLIVIGERDRTTELYEERYAEWSAFGDRVELATVPKAGHYFLKHQADQLADHLRRNFGRWSRGTLPRPVPPPDAGKRDLRVFSAVAVFQTLSLIGTGLSGFGLGLYVLQETGSVTQYSMVTMLAMLPAILLSPLGGALADRFERRVMMLLADSAAGVGTIALAVVWWTGHLAVWQVYVVVTLGSVATAFHRPAWFAAVSQLVPKPYLVQANGVVFLGAGLGVFLAPLAGGAILVNGGLGTLLLVDTVTFLLSTVMLLLVKFPNRMFRKQEESFRRSLTGGWRFVLRRPPLVAMTAFFVVANLLLAIPQVLAAPVALAIGSAALVGTVTAIGGLGAAVGAIVMVIWGGTKRRVMGMVGFTAGLGVGAVIMGAVANGWVLGAGLFVLWFSLNVLNSHWLALIQRKVGLDLQGRVIAANQMLATSAMPIGFLISGPLVSAAGGLDGLLPGPAGAERLVLMVVGVALIVWTVIGLRWPPLRDLEDHLPDAQPGAEVADDLDAVQEEADAALRKADVLVS